MSDDGQAVVEKKGRGRPKANGTPAKEKSGGDTKKRGRPTVPAKIVKESAKSSDEEAPAAKRGRGRPKGTKKKNAKEFDQKERTKEHRGGQVLKCQWINGREDVSSSEDCKPVVIEQKKKRGRKKKVQTIEINNDSDESSYSGYSSNESSEQELLVPRKIRQYSKTTREQAAREDGDEEHDELPFSEQEIIPSQFECKRRQDFNTAIKTVNQTLNNLKDVLADSSPNASFSNHDDEFSDFGKYVASQIRNLPLVSGLLVKEKIHKLITEKRIACANASNIHETVKQNHQSQLLPRIQSTTSYHTGGQRVSKIGSNLTIDLSLNQRVKHVSQRAKSKSITSPHNHLASDTVSMSEFSPASATPRMDEEDSLYSESCYIMK